MVVVLGGGLCGLSVAYYLLRKHGQTSAIFEASNRLGGWIRTEDHKNKGFIFETGPRTIRPKGLNGANTLEMLHHLELEVEPIAASHIAAKNRLIYAKGELCALPNSIGGIFGRRPPFSKPLYTAILHDLRATSKPIKNGDESIYSFVQRRFGTELADYLISPLICGICAGDAKDISVRFLMNDLFETEQKFGGIIKGIVLGKFLGRQNVVDRKHIDLNTPGLFCDNTNNVLYQRALEEKWSMYRVIGGLEMLPKTLEQFLRANNAEINLSAECHQISFQGNGEGVVLKIRGQQIHAKRVVSTIPTYRLAACVKDQHPGLAALLLAIPYVDVAVVNLQYNTANLLKRHAFGVLVPPIEQRPILGIIFDSCCFDMCENTVLTVMMGGKWFEEYFGDNPTKKDLLDIAKREVQSILNISEEPKLTRVNILKKCIPQYKVGHQQLIEGIRRYIDRYKLQLNICGAAFDGVGINDVIMSARKNVEGLF